MKNRSLEFTTFKTKEFVDQSAYVLKGIIEELFKDTDKISIALSGGNSPLPIYKKLARFNLDWQNISFFIVDERCVPNDHPDSNYGNINNCLFKFVKSKNFPMVNSGFSYQQNAEQYEEQIKQHVNIVNDLPQFDLVILGMGLDGHIASLFPGTKALDETENLVVLNRIPQLKANRITMTYPLIINSRNIILLIKGEQKLKVLKDKSNDDFPISKIIPYTRLILN